MRFYQLTFIALIIALSIFVTHSVYEILTDKRTVVTAKPVFQKLNPIVRLVKNNMTFCSGFVIDDHTLVTAGHCVLRQGEFGLYTIPDEIEIRAYNNKPLGVTGEVEYTDIQLDHAILKGDFRKFEPAIYISDVKELEKIRILGKRFTSCGYPLGGNLYCSTITYVGPYGFMVKTKGILLPGMSGGPTMLDDGTIIGTNNLVTEEDSVISPLYNIDFHK